MQTVVQVICKGTGSLRTAIANDKKLSKFGLKVKVQQKPGRNHGWTKIRGTNQQKGAINIDWDAQINTLFCRIVTKQKNKPTDIIPDLIKYLMNRQLKRIASIHVYRI